jgi:hypothetical protein
VRATTSGTCQSAGRRARGICKEARPHVRAAASIILMHCRGALSPIAPTVSVALRPRRTGCLRVNFLFFKPWPYTEAGVCPLVFRRRHVCKVFRPLAAALASALDGHLGWRDCLRRTRFSASADRQMLTVGRNKCAASRRLPRRMVVWTPAPRQRGARRHGAGTHES